MKHVRRSVCAVLALAAVGIAVAGWAKDRPNISSPQAVSAVRHAFATAQVTVAVGERPFADTYVSKAKQAVDVWRVEAQTRDGKVELFLARADARPVAIDDRTPDGSGYLLTAGQYDAVARGIDDPSLATAVRQRVGLTVGAVLIVAMALALALVEPRRA